MIALHYEAAALHSLTDLFALGHNVVDRSKTAKLMLDVTNNQSTQPMKDLADLLNDNGIRYSSNGSNIHSADFKEENVIPEFSTLHYSTEDSVANFSLPATNGSLYYSSKTQRDIHDSFNKSGAIVNNYRGDQFQIYGDGKYNDLDELSKQVIQKAVEVSIQTIFDVFNGDQAVTYIFEPGSELAIVHYKAISYLPYWISDEMSNNYLGNYMLTSRMIEEILNEPRVPHHVRCIVERYGVTNMIILPPIGSSDLCADFEGGHHGRGLLSVEIPIAESSSWISSAGPSHIESGNPHYTINVDKKSYVKIDLSSSVDTYLFLLDSNGNTIAFNDDGGEGLNSRIISMIEPGRYTIVAATFENDQTADFVLTTNISEYVYFPLSKNNSWNTSSGRNSNGMGNPKYTFELTSRTLIKAELNSNVDNYLYLLDSNWQVIKADDDSGVDSNAKITKSLEPGLYTLVAATFNADQEDNFTLNVDRFYNFELDCYGTNGLPTWSGSEDVLTIKVFGSDGVTQSQQFLQSDDSCNNSNMEIGFLNIEEIEKVHISTPGSDAFWIDRIRLNDNWVGADNSKGWMVSIDEDDYSSEYADSIPRVCWEFRASETVGFACTD